MTRVTGTMDAPHPAYYSSYHHMVLIGLILRISGDRTKPQHISNSQISAYTMFTIVSFLRSVGKVHI